MADYINLESPYDVDRLIERSASGRVAIFKHSTTCPISSMAKNRVDRALSQDKLDLEVYLVDLLRHRQVSNYIADELQVRHESPQLIVVEAGSVVYHASHLAIDPAAIPAAGVL